MNPLGEQNREIHAAESPWYALQAAARRRSLTPRMATDELSPVRFGWPATDREALRRHPAAMVRYNDASGGS